MKLTPKQVFLLKATLGIIIANNAGGYLSYRIPFSGRWDGAFNGAFFSLIGIVIIQWILLSDYLPKGWLVTGLIGCIISASAMGTINYHVSEQIFRLIIQEYNIACGLLMGILASIPQWFVLKHQRGYVWVLANGIGWMLSSAFDNLNFYLQVTDFARLLIREISFMPLGILLSLYLYSHLYKPNNREM